MIQIITYDIRKYKDYPESKYNISRLGEIKAFDDFELCVIDLTDENIWENNGVNPDNVNCRNDLITIREAIDNCLKSKIIILFPQNEEFDYHRDYDYKMNTYVYKNSVQIKDNKENTISIINRFIYNLDGFSLSFEKTKTSLNDIDVNADFNFNKIGEGYEKITLSKNSEKITSVHKDNIYITTLDISRAKEQLESFISIHCIKNKTPEEIPEWIRNIKFYNDDELEAEKDNNNIKIQELKNKNIELQKQLDENMEYKSILYSNGEELVKVVLKILDEILEYDSSKFVDEKREDFLIKKDDITFIGEIKGLSSAVQNKNISQLEVHIQNYYDKLQENGIEENVKGLLVINHQRNKTLEERQEIHEHQKKLAEKYGSLIIETKTLLTIYEKYKKGDLTYQACKNLFESNVGILEI